MAKKRIIQLPEALEYADDAVIAIDDAVNGTQKLPLSEVIGGGGGSGSSVPTINVPVFTPMWFDHECPSDAWMFSPQAYSQGNGYGWKKGSDFPKAYDHLVKDLTGASSVTETVAGVSMTFFRAADGHQVIVADGIADSGTTSADTLFTACGVSWFYVLDKTNQRFRLPRTRYSLQGMKNGGSVEKYDAAGLPQHTHTILGIQYTPSSGEWGISGYDYKSGSTTSGSASSTIYGASTTVQPPATEMYLYFSSGIENDVVGGGVIDGTKFTLNNGQTSLVNEVEINNKTAVKVYTTENDCALYIQDISVEDVNNPNDIDINYYLDQAMTCPISMSTQSAVRNGPRNADGTVQAINNDFEYQGRIVQLKKGCSIYAKRNAHHLTNGIIDDAILTGRAKITFIEYKLNSLAPQIAMPDWDGNKSTVIVNKSVTGSTTYTVGTGSFPVPENGYIKVSRWGHIKTGSCSINDQSLATFVEAQLYDDACFIVPVSKNDLFKWHNVIVGDTVTAQGGMIAFIFYPTKSVPVTKSEKADLEQKITELSGTVADTYLSATTFDTWKTNDYATAMSGKANNATTLAGYGIADAYTQEQTNTAITNAIGDLDVTVTGTDASKTLASLTEADGKIAATFQSIAIAESQVTNLTTDLAAKTSSSDIPYDLSAVTTGFADRAVNTATMNGNLTMTLPTQVSGKVRDFVVTLTVTAAGALTVTGLDHYYYDAGADDPITTAFEAGKTYQLYFTEAASGVFRVGRTELVYK